MAKILIYPFRGHRRALRRAWPEHVITFGKSKRWTSELLFDPAVSDDEYERREPLFDLVMLREDGKEGLMTEAMLAQIPHIVALYRKRGGPKSMLERDITFHWQRDTIGRSRVNWLPMSILRHTPSGQDHILFWPDRALYRLHHPGNWEYLRFLINGWLNPA